jgi:hypothetical protein
LVALDSGESAAALPLLRQARAVWERLGGRYEIARCRVQLGRTLRALGDEESAVIELAAAQHSFAELGAAPAEREVAALITATYPSGLTGARGRSAAARRGREIQPRDRSAAVPQRKNRRRHLSNIFTKLDVTSRTAAAAFAYEHHIT